MTKLTKELLTILLQTCFSIREILECAGYSRCSGNNYSTFHRAIKNYSLETEYEAFKLKVKSHVIPINKLTDEQMFCVGSVFRGTRLRARILEKELLPYECANTECPTRYLDGKWLGNEIVYELDHVNGSNRDNRLENLRFLCLYCHRQTPTYGNKNNTVYEVTVPSNDYDARNVTLVRNRENKCTECFTSIDFYAKTCKACVPKIKKFEISKEALEQLIKEMPMCKIGKLLGVSGTAVKKRCKKLGIFVPPMRGYWAKVAAGQNPELPELDDYD